MWKWHDIQPSTVTNTRNSCTAFTHPRCTHTMNTHPEQWAARGAVGVTPQSWYWGWRESAVQSLLHLQFLLARDSNSQPFNHKSDSLTIRPRLLHDLYMYINISLLEISSIIYNNLSFTISPTCPQSKSHATSQAHLCAQELDLCLRHCIHHQRHAHRSQSDASKRNDMNSSLSKTMNGWQKDTR